MEHQAPQTPVSSLHEPLLAMREDGHASAVKHAVAGLLPSHRCSIVELRTKFDPAVSITHLLMSTILRDRLSGEVVASRDDVCFALDCKSTEADRQTYVSEMCRIIAPYVKLHHLNLAQLAPVVEAMNADWNILEAFQILDEIDQALMGNISATPVQLVTASTDDACKDKAADSFSRAELAQILAALEQQAIHANAFVDMKKALQMIHGADTMTHKGSHHQAIEAHTLSHLAAKTRRMLGAHLQQENQQA